jgi:hypothetical protein
MLNGRADPGVQRTTEKPSADYMAYTCGMATRTTTSGHHAQQADFNSDATPTRQPQHHLGVTEFNNEKAEHRMVPVGYLQRLTNISSDDSRRCDAGDHQSLH